MPEPKKNPFSLAMIGGICILAGVVSGLVGPSATDRSSALGKAAAQLLFVIVGIGLIITHFVRQYSRKSAHTSHHSRSEADKRHARKKHRRGGE
jgi:hypothetical protein